MKTYLVTITNHADGRVKHCLVEIAESASVVALAAIGARLEADYPGCDVTTQCLGSEVQTYTANELRTERRILGSF